MADMDAHHAPTNDSVQEISHVVALLVEVVPAGSQVPARDDPADRAALHDVSDLTKNRRHAALQSHNCLRIVFDGQRRQFARDLGVAIEWPLDVHGLAGDQTGLDGLEMAIDTNTADH